MGQAEKLYSSYLKGLFKEYLETGDTPFPEPGDNPDLVNLTISFEVNEEECRQAFDLLVNKFNVSSYVIHDYAL